MQSIVFARVTLPVPRQIRSLPGIKGLAFAVTALLATLGGGWYATEWWRAGRFIEATDDAYARGNVTAVAPHVAGFVGQLLITDNQHVEPGQVLLRLDDRDYRAALARADAIVTKRQAALDGLQATLALQRIAIRRAEADLAAKTAAAGFARQEEFRYAALALTPAGSRQRAEQAQSAGEAARADNEAAAATVDAARQRLRVTDASIAEARAGVAAAEAELATARLNLGYTEIRSPIEGYVGNRAAQEGAYVAAGAYLLSIVPARNLWIEANFKEDQLARMQKGQPATIVADALPGRIFHGHVESLAPGTGAIFSVIPPENATGNFTKIVQRVPIRIALDDGDARLGPLRPGLSMTVRVDTRPAAPTGE